MNSWTPLNTSILINKREMGKSMCKALHRHQLLVRPADWKIPRKKQTSIGPIASRSSVGVLDFSCARVLGYSSDNSGSPRGGWVTLEHWSTTGTGKRSKSKEVRAFSQTLVLSLFWGFNQMLNVAFTNRPKFANTTLTHFIWKGLILTLGKFLQWVNSDFHLQEAADL